MPTTTRRIGFKIVPRLLDHIGLAMYSSIPKAVSELVANSYDANATEVRILVVTNDECICEIAIADNGDGMSPEELENRYLALGYNKRSLKKSASKRKPIGSKGIGKLAGLGIATTMEIASVRNNTKSILTITRDDTEKEQTHLTDLRFPITVERTRASRGTVVTLKDLLSHAQTVDIGDLRDFLASQFGLTKDFEIFVNGQGLTTADIEGEKRRIRDSVPGYGPVSGSIVIAKKSLRNPGLTIYVRGRAVEGPTLYDINSPKHHYRVANRIAGQIAADFLDPDIPRHMLDAYIISTSRESFSRNHPAYVAFKRWAEDQLTTIARELERQQAKERIAELQTNPSIQKVLKDLPPALRMRFEESIRAIVPMLNDLSDANAQTIMEFISRLAEPQSMLRILQRFEEADEKDVTALAKLLEDWGIYEVASLSTLIKSRLEVIRKFEALIDDQATREFPDVHLIIENNLWILDDNFRFYSSNQQMKKILNAELAEKFAANEELRPDFICRSLLDKHVVVEIKRPAHKISYDDVSQLFGYANILKRIFRIRKFSNAF